MLSVEELHSKLLHFEDPEELKKFVLYRSQRDKNKPGKLKHQEMSRKYAYESDKNKKAIKLIRDTYLDWGLLERIEKIEDGETLYYYIITKKGRKALKWKYIAPQKPDWLTERKKYAITTLIAILALILSAISLLRTF